MSKPATSLFVCTTCRKEIAGQPAGEDGPFELPGVRLLEAIQTQIKSLDDIEVVGVECLAVCKRPCTVALSCENKWTYIVGDLDADADVADVIAAARAYHASDNGIVAWRERPKTFRKGVVARIPPPEFRGVEPKEKDAAE